MVDGSVVSRLVAKRAIISLGCSDADFHQTQAVLKQGARVSTHMFNAMSPMMNRAPELLAVVINSDTIQGLLTIPARSIPDWIFIVSDSMPSVDGPDQLDLYGRMVVLQNGRLVNLEGILADVHIKISQAVTPFINQ